MTSSRLETPVHTPGAYRAHRRAPYPSAQRSPARYEPHLDGLFTYCLSVLCDHEAATDVLGSVLAIAERQDSRCPAGEEERKSWLYALARWTCLRTLTEQKRGRQAHRRPTATGQGDRAAPEAPGSGRPGAPPTPTTPGPAAGIRPASGIPGTQDMPDVQGAQRSQKNPGAPRTPEDAVTPGPCESPALEARRRELAQLAWPEAAGTTPEQREALELAVRHRLTPRAVAAVLGLEPVTARELLAGAACEVERTRAALAVVETGNCRTVARLTGDHQVLLSTALRGELVRHVDDCPRCRRAAERAGAGGPWPGASVTPAAALPVVEAPRPSVYVAMVHARRTRSATPRFDRTGFPLAPKDHAARRDRLRARVVTTTVVATVVAAPVIALWAAYRGAPLTGEGHSGSSVTATAVDGGDGLDGHPYEYYENTGNTRPGENGRFRDGARQPDVSAEVISARGSRHASRDLAVAVGSLSGHTVITLTARGSEPVAWSARTDAPWLHLSRSSGTLAPGRSVTVRVFVDRRAEPDGSWSARVLLAPSGSAVAIGGYGSTRSPSHGGTAGRPAPPYAPHPAPDPVDRPPRSTTDPTGPAQSPSGPSATPPPSGTPAPADPTPTPAESSTQPPTPSPTGQTSDPGTTEPSG